MSQSDREGVAQRRGPTGSITEGHAISDVFIENGRFDDEKIFG